MKKNKTVAYLMAAALLVGGTFLGTKAWFFSNNAATNDLVITTGTMDVIVNQEEGWTNVNSEGYQWQGTIEGNHAKNVQPGDSFKKTIKIENHGTLKQKITVPAENVQPVVSIQTIKDILAPKLTELSQSLQAKIVPELTNLIGNIDVSSIPGLNEYKNTFIGLLEEFNFQNISKGILDGLNFGEMMTYSLDKSALATKSELEAKVGDKVDSTSFDIVANIETNYGITGNEKEVVTNAIKNELNRVMKEEGVGTNTQKYINMIFDLVVRNIDFSIESIISDLFEGKTIEFKYLCEPIEVNATQVTYDK